MIAHLLNMIADCLTAYNKMFTKRTLGFGRRFG